MPDDDEKEAASSPIVAQMPKENDEKKVDQLLEVADEKPLILMFIAHKHGEELVQIGKDNPEAVTLLQQVKVVSPEHGKEKILVSMSQTQLVGVVPKNGKDALRVLVDIDNAKGTLAFFSYIIRERGCANKYYFSFQLNLQSKLFARELPLLLSQRLTNTWLPMSMALSSRSIMMGASLVMAAFLLSRSFQKMKLVTSIACGVDLAMMAMA
jgi:hypothetical protein